MKTIPKKKKKNILKTKLLGTKKKQTQQKNWETIQKKRTKKKNKTK
jgi:hypothetical protein